jgi:hypothetical protein
MVMKRRRRLVPEIFLQLAHRVCPFWMYFKFA